MHLSHTLPWNCFSRHFEFVVENKAFYGQPSGLFPKNDDRQNSDGLHFVHVFADTIEEFALTERRKFPDKLNQNAPLFSDDMLDETRFHLDPYSSNDNRALPLSESMQKVLYWKQKGEQGFSTENGNLADAVKFLIQQHESKALLTLCQATPLSGLFNLSWGHGFGVYFQVYTSFRMYVLLNLVYAVQQDNLVKGKKPFGLFDIPMVRKEVLECFDNNDYSTQYIAHRQFWEAYVENRTYNGEGTIFTDPFETNPAALKQYLSNCFRDLYLYDMIMRECGDKNTKDFWVRDMILTLNYMFRPLSLPEPEYPAE